MNALAYAFVTSFATLVGGGLPLYTRLKRIESRYLIGFASGAMIAIALLDLVPELSGNSLWAVAVGFFGLYLLEKLVLLHTCGEDECETHTFGWPALIGIAAESLVDGVAIAVSFQVAPALGLAVTLAVFVHELPRGLTTSIIMRSAGYGRLATWGALLVDAGFTPLGVLFGGIVPASAIEIVIGLAAGTFLYVGASDLLPDAHRRFNFYVILSTLAGAGLIAGLGGLR